jgi:ketosteroid isomerase-like protein
MLRRMTTLFTLVAALAAFGAPARAADNATEVAALIAVDSAWEKAYNAGDVEGVVKLYAADAVLLPPGAPSANGTAAIRAFFGKDIPGLKSAGLTMIMGAKPQAGSSGDMGWASGTYTVKDKSGKVIDTGKYLSVSRKVDGKWMYVRDTWNSDAAPAPAPAPAAPAKK